MRAASATLVSLLTAAQLRGQPVGVVSAHPVIGAVFHSWVPARPVGNDSVRVESVTQYAVPLVAHYGGVGRATLDLSVAGAYSEVVVRRGAAPPEALQLIGPTDVRVLFSLGMFRDHLALLIGGTGPTGKVKLKQDELTALGAVGAPAVGAPVPALGGGAGGSTGLTGSAQVGEWTFTGGGSFEYRTQFSPIGQLTAGVPLDSRITPGAVIAFSGRARGAILGTSVLVDLGLRQFRADTFALSTRTQSSRVIYRLGNFSTFGLRIEPDLPQARDLVLSFARQARAAYEVAGVGPVIDSDAALTTLGATATVFRRGRFRIAAGLDRRAYSGVGSDSSLVAAKFGERGASLSVAIPMGNAEFVLTGGASQGTVTLRNSDAIATRRLTVRGQVNAF